MRTAALAVALALCAVLLPACGGSDHSPSRDATARTSPFELPDLQDASCRDWKRSPAPARQLLLRALRASRAQPVTGRGVRGRGTVLGDRQAQHMLDALCNRPQFQAFRLYRLYALASDFVGTAP